MMWLCTLAWSAIGLSSIAPPEPTAFPIEPHPLRVLCERSDLIVFGVVTAVEKDPNVLTWFDRPTTVAVLDVSKVLYGEAGIEVRVGYAPEVVCPTPPRYVVGETVLAFLSRQDESPYFCTTGLSYGSKTMNAADAEVYGKHIRHYFDLHDRALDHDLVSAQEFGESLNDWWIGMCLDPATRREGTWELQSGVRGLKRPGTNEEMRIPSWTEAQRQRVRQMLLNDYPIGSFGALELIRRVEPRDDEALNDLMLDHLQQALGDLTPESFRFTPHVMKLLLGSKAEWDQRPLAIAVLERYSEVRRTPLEESESREEHADRIHALSIVLLREFVDLVMDEDLLK